MRGSIATGCILIAASFGIGPISAQTAALSQSELERAMTVQAELEAVSVEARGLEQIVESGRRSGHVSARGRTMPWARLMEQNGSTNVALRFDPHSAACFR